MGIQGANPNQIKAKMVDGLEVADYLDERDTPEVRTFVESQVGMQCMVHAFNNALAKRTNLLLHRINAGTVPDEGFGTKDFDDELAGLNDDSTFDANAYSARCLNFSDDGSGDSLAAQAANVLLRKAFKPTLLGFIYHTPGHWLAIRRQEHGRFYKVDSQPAARGRRRGGTITYMLHGEVIEKLLALGPAG